MLRCWRMKHVDRLKDVQICSMMLNCWIMLNLYYPTCFFLDFRSSSSNGFDHDLQRSPRAETGRNPGQAQGGTFYMSSTRKRMPRKLLLCHLLETELKWHLWCKNVLTCQGTNAICVSHCVNPGVWSQHDTFLPGGSSNRRRHAWQCSKRYSNPRTWGGCPSQPCNLRYSFQSQEAIKFEHILYIEYSVWYYYLYMVIDLKVLVKSFNCEDSSCYVGNPRESFFRVRESNMFIREEWSFPDKGILINNHT
jgi:hypothetical protein